MNTRALRASAILGATVLVSSMLATAAYATGPFSGTVTGTFSAPVLTGNVINVDGSLGAMNNSGTAITTLTSDAQGNSTLSWGDGDASTLEFLNGHGVLPGGGSLGDFGPVVSGQTFHLGTIIYHNSSNSLPSLIFGAQLTLGTGGVATPLVENVNIFTTANTGLSAARDSDFVTFGGLGSSFNVYEGATSSIELNGTIVGDPMMTFDFFQISPVATGAGFVGSGVGGIPEPTTWALTLLGFFSLGGALRVRRRSELALSA